MSCDIGEATKRLENELSSFSNLAVTLPTSQLILRPFSRFTNVTAHSPTLPLLHLHHSSLSNPSVASPTSQLILQPFIRFSYVTGSSLMSPGEPPKFTGHFIIQWALLILQLFRHFTYVTAHSPTLQLLHLRHSSFSNHSVASPTSQVILQPFVRFSYVTGVCFSYVRGSSLRHLASRPNLQDISLYRN